MINYKVKDIVKCMVTAIEGYGFFVNTELGVSGLVHISEISKGYIKDINAFVKVGDTIYCQILDINKENGQLTLSIKNINYKSNKNKNLVTDNYGFLPLKNALPKWIKEKESEYN